MHILALQAENMAKIKAVRIEPNGKLVEITGKNANGKTSVLRTIWCILGGKDEFAEVPVRLGETRAVGQLDIGDDSGVKYRATLRITMQDEGRYTHTLTVENGDGARYSNPQTMMKDLLGTLTLDPLEFAEADAATQLKMVRALVKDVDFDEIDRLNKVDFNERTDVNRRAKDLAAQANGIVVPPDAPDAPVDEEALISKLTNASSHNTEIEQRRARRAKVAEDVASMKAEAEEMRQLATDLREKAAAADAEAEKLDAAAAEEQKRLDEAPPLPELTDIGEVQAEILKAKTANAAYQAAQRKQDLQKQAQAEEEKAAALTKAIDGRKEQIKKAILEAKLPVAGLSLDEDRVLLDGLPLKQASDAQQLVASLKIAAAMNPKLRVATVRGGEKLDEDALRLLAKTAEEINLQIWMERVDNSGKVGFVMEDGEVKGQEPFETLLKPEKKGKADKDGQAAE
ncbi:nucleoside triphosphate hydrolase [Caulobacter phage Sansa]|uniref:Nucleoside triphosphate hydrolase n=1 Tax=Caulobacter phage Sansa TaxID=1675600 RepID=A0A0K1LLT3_9CAUD|nr:nucleoside triphosphate hydrolase [Caulobacter phage Sansa]AKU43472.1 nucleoside triphosphate hydrolase [Caulobacter phage Sansa]